jgi:hypothetical protein
VGVIAARLHWEAVAYSKDLIQGYGESDLNGASTVKMSALGAPDTANTLASPPKPLNVASHRGTLILVFGILGIVFCFPLGIAAWIMGRQDLKAMDAGSMDPSGRGNTNAGRICGMIGTLLAGVTFALVLIGLLVVLGMQSKPAWQPTAPPQETNPTIPGR